jgi:hypothetical protein
MNREDDEHEPIDEAILSLEADPRRAATLVEILHEVVQPRLYRDEEASLSPAGVARLVEWYGLPGVDAVARFPILRTLAIDGSPQALAALADLISTAPPTDERQAVLALVPLFQPRGERLSGAAALFPRLLDAVAHPPLAPVVLDLANFLTRRGYVPEHPAKPRAAELATLLGSLAQRLAKIEESPAEFASSPAELSKVVNDSVTLVVSLCDALALAGDPGVSGKLHQALSLAHRRVQTEAAAALARLGDEQGVEHLKLLAAQPAARTRVLAYLEELGRLDVVEEQYRTNEARAAGDLAAWMAQPTRFGLAPDELELIDVTKQYWPGYVDPVECFLFTYEYHRGGRTAAGVGIAGPMTSALQCDLQDFPPVDIYALYAGLDVEHDEIFDTPLVELSDVQDTAWEQVREELSGQGYADVELVRWSNFFGEQHAVATAARDGRGGVIVVADDTAEWFGLPASARGMRPDEVYALYKGRKLLKSFNRNQE